MLIMRVLNQRIYYDVRSYPSINLIMNSNLLKANLRMHYTIMQFCGFGLVYLC